MDFHVDIDTHYNDSIEYLNNNYDKKSDLYKKGLSVINNGGLFNMNDGKINTIKYSCTREDYKYLYSRGIDMKYEYIRKNGKYIDSFYITNKICAKYGY